MEEQQNMNKFKSYKFGDFVVLQYINKGDQFYREGEEMIDTADASISNRMYTEEEQQNYTNEH